MRLLRGLLGAVLWIVASLLGLVGILLCVTVILLPVGIPLTKLAGRLLSHSVQLMLPRALVHPGKQVTKAVDKKGREIRSATSKSAKKGRKTLRKQAKSLV